MRQIGPRDVAKLLGGFGACGELRCCSTFLTDFSPISIKMAKAQGISLNPSEITGMCGRLRCCLVYEYEQYVQARQQLPKKNKRIGTPEGEGRVIDVLPLQDAVLVAVGDGLHAGQARGTRAAGRTRSDGEEGQRTLRQAGKRRVRLRRETGCGGESRCDSRSAQADDGSADEAE